MKRKLFSVLLCAFALLLLMGAAAAPQPVALLAEEESAVSNEAALETEAQVSTGIQESNPSDLTQVEEPNKEPNDISAQQTVNSSLLIDGQAAPADIGLIQRSGVTYVALAPMATALIPETQISWDGTTVKLFTDHLTLTACVGEHYLVANGRYLYLPKGVEIVNNMVTVPLWAVAKAMDAQIGWDSATGTVLVTRGSGAIQPGEAFYNQEDLFWLSRVIFAESGNQSLQGKLAVGNVVMNRVASPIYPDTVKGVLAQKNQFSTYKNGALANRTPNESCIIAAKLVLDGAVVEETRNALYFDSSVQSWASRNRQHIATIGDHKFYS